MTLAASSAFMNRSDRYRVPNCAIRMYRTQYRMPMNRQAYVPCLMRSYLPAPRFWPVKFVAAMANASNGQASSI